MIDTKVGDEVRVIEDCREESTATGQTGTYEGRFPIPSSEDRYPDNPRIRLADGSMIWGAECWWENVTDDMAPLEEAQGRVQEYRIKFAYVLDELYAAVMHQACVHYLGRRRNRFLRWQRKQIPLNFVQWRAYLARWYVDAEQFGYEGTSADS